MSRTTGDQQDLIVTIVLVGPRGSGKSSLLRSVRQRVQPDRLLNESAHTEGLSHLQVPLLDWLPLNLGMIGGRNVRVDLYAVSGSHAFESTRRLLLADADGLLVVLDSQALRIDDNVTSLRELQDQLLDREGDLRDLPQVFVYPKQDLPGELILTPELLDEALNFRGAPSYAVDSVKGTGVLEAIHTLVTLMLRRIAATTAAVG